MKGLSLIELLIMTAVGGIVGILLVQLLVQNSSYTTQQSAKVAQGISLNDLTYAVSNDIKLAGAVASGYPVSSPSYTTNSTNLVLKINSIDSNGNIINQTYDYIVVNQDSTNTTILREQLFPDATSSRRAFNHVLVTNLSSIQFSYLDPNDNPITPIQAAKVNFVVTVSNQNGIYVQQNSSSAKVSLRNS